MMFAKYIRAFSVVPTFLPHDSYRPDLFALLQHAKKKPTPIATDTHESVLMYVLFAPN